MFSLINNKLRMQQKKNKHRLSLLNFVYFSVIFANYIYVNVGKSKRIFTKSWFYRKEFRL